MVDKAHVGRARLFLHIEAFFEMLALFCVCGLRYDIYQAETKKNLDEEQQKHVNEVGEEFFQADVLWMLAFISCFISAIYGIYLSKKLAKDLDICDFYHQRDQETYDKIIAEDSGFKLWKDQSAIEVDGKNIKGR